MLEATGDRAAAEFEIYRANRHTLVIPVGPGAARVIDSEECDESPPLPGRVRSDCANLPHAASTDGRPANDARCRRPALAAARRSGIQIICRYDSLPETDQAPLASCLLSVTATPAVDIDDFSSIVEIDGDCVIIHSRQDDTAEAEAEAKVDDMDAPTEEMQQVAAEVMTPISERCRRFYERRLRSRQLAAVSDDVASDSDDVDSGPTSVDSGQESGPDCRGRTVRHALQKALKPTSSLKRKMTLLRREMRSLMHQDDNLFRQLLALNDSIQALKHTDAAWLSPASSFSSLPELADDSCSPSSTLSSASSGRQSHLSIDSGNYALTRSDQWWRWQLVAPFPVAGDGSQSRLETPPPPPPHHTTASPSPLSSIKRRPPMGHRKQGSCDSGIVEQEPRENT